MGTNDVCTVDNSIWPVTSKNGWVTIEQSLEACPSDTNIRRVSLQVKTRTNTPNLPGTTLVWIDSMWIERDGVKLTGIEFNFDRAVSVSPVALGRAATTAANQYPVPGRPPHAANQHDARLAAIAGLGSTRANAWSIAGKTLARGWWLTLAVRRTSAFERDFEPDEADISGNASGRQLTSR